MAAKSGFNCVNKNFISIIFENLPSIRQNMSPEYYVEVGFDFSLDDMHAKLIVKMRSCLYVST